MLASLPYDAAIEAMATSSVSPSPTLLNRVVGARPHPSRKGPRRGSRRPRGDGAYVVAPSASRARAVMKVLRMSRLTGLSRLMFKAQKLAAAQQIRLAQLLLVFLTLAHWAGCCFFYLAKWQALNLKAVGNRTTGNPWIVRARRGGASPARPSRAVRSRNGEAAHARERSSGSASSTTTLRRSTG